MPSPRLEGTGILCATLERLGARHVFGMPGTQNVPLFESLRTSRLRTVVPTHELAASFMAGAYYRVSGRPGVLVTIPGPGFAYALPGLAEARLDSAAVIHIVGTPARSPGRRFHLQALDQAAIAAPLVKQVFEVLAADRLSEAVCEAHRAALAGEPGPVLVHVSPEAFRGQAPFDAAALQLPPPPVQAPRAQDLEAAARLITGAARVVVFAGQGALQAADAVRRLAERLSAPVLTTPSARGIVPEDHSLSLAFDTPRGGIERVNDLLAQADVVLILGCKLGHNGTAGFRLTLPPAHTIQVDASREVLGATYDVTLPIQASTEAFLGHLDAALGAARPGGSWTLNEIADWRRQIRAAAPAQREPALVNGSPATPEVVFRQLRHLLPRDAVLVTDSGQHQVMARRYYDVLAPGGLLLPSDFQSMGFGLPAAIAAKLAAPERTVLALLGDGGLAMSGLELGTAVREGIPLTTVVFSDGRLGQIWSQQISEYGRAHATRVVPVNVEGLAQVTGARHLTFGALLADGIAGGRSGVRLTEVELERSLGDRTAQAARLIKEGLRGVFGSASVDWLKRAFGP